MNFEKYEENLQSKVFEEKFNSGDEQVLIINPLGNDFSVFANKTLKELNGLLKEIKLLRFKTKGVKNE